jgi:hypothetical protein
MRFVAAAQARQNMDCIGKQSLDLGGAQSDRHKNKHSGSVSMARRDRGKVAHPVRSSTS